MKRATLLLILLAFFGISSLAQKMTGFGGELSVLSLKPNVRMWVSKSNGFEVFFGQASELQNFKPNDLEAGFKYLYTIMYNRTDRTYVGVVGKWKWLNVYGSDVYGSDNRTNLPIAGAFIGREWFNRRINRKSFAIEMGYQYGIKEYGPIDKGITFTEFPLILNLRYSFYKKR